MIPKFDKVLPVRPYGVLRTKHEATASESSKDYGYRRNTNHQSTITKASVRSTGVETFLQVNLTDSAGGVQSAPLRAANVPAPRTVQTIGVGSRERSAVKRNVESRHLTSIGLRQCANQKPSLNRALLAGPSRVSLAGCAGPQGSNNMAWRAVA